MKIYLLIPDIHVPFHDKAFIDLSFRLAQIIKPYGIVHLGDALDFYQVSSYDKDPDRKASIADDAIIYRRILKQWAALLPKDGVLHQLEGNHESRLTRYIWKHAKELSGLVQTVPEMIGLSDLPCRAVWHPISKWDSCRIGDAVCHHGHYFNQHVAVGNLTKYPVSFICGHTHRVQMVGNGSRFSATIGHGSLEKLTAHQPTPTGWQQAMGLLTVAGDKTWLEVILVNNGRCVINGKEIKG